MDKPLLPEAILFDMDGVLVDSFDSWYESLNSTLKHFKQKEISKEEFKEKYWGNELQENLKRLGLDKKIGSFCINIYEDYTDKIKIFSGTKKTLEKLDTYKKAIITNTPRNCTFQILKKYEIKKYFDVLITSDQIENGKPAPDMINKACEKLEVNPGNCVFIGDTKNDVKAGNKAGCTVIGIKIDADYKINKIDKLLDIIEN